MEKRLGPIFLKRVFLSFKTLVALPLSVFILLSSLNAHAQETDALSELSEQKSCESEIVQQDLEARYGAIQKKLEEDYKKGVPKKMRDQLIGLRAQLDELNLKLFDIDKENNQEVNFMAQKVIQALDEIITVLPKAALLAPEVRNQYVVPFTNINSLIAENQDCLMEIAVENAEKEIADHSQTTSSGNIYKKLTSELKQLNENLYKLETTDSQKFISLRTQLMNDLENYNSNKEKNINLSSNLPQMVNSMQAEIERVIPGLELSKKYFSIAH